MARRSSRSKKEKETFAESVQSFVDLLNTDLRDLKPSKKEASSQASTASAKAGSSGSASELQAAHIQLPTKRTMNLYYRADRGAKQRKLILVTLLVICIALLIAKITIYDPLSDIAQREEVINQKTTELAKLKASLSNYNQVKEEFTRLSSTDVERGHVDRLKVLQMIQSAAGSKASITNVSITGTQATLSLSGVTLGQVSEIVNALEASPLTTQVKVSTASTSGATQGQDTVLANLSFTLNDAAQAAQNSQAEKGGQSAPSTTNAGTGAQ